MKGSLGRERIRLGGGGFALEFVERTPNDLTIVSADRNGVVKLWRDGPLPTQSTPTGTTSAEPLIEPLAKSELRQVAQFTGVKENPAADRATLKLDLFLLLVHHGDQQRLVARAMTRLVTAFRVTLI
jgi:hypothetical protein